MIYAGHYFPQKGWTWVETVGYFNPLSVPNGHESVELDASSVAACFWLAKNFSITIDAEAAGRVISDVDTFSTGVTQTTFAERFIDFADETDLTGVWLPIHYTGTITGSDVRMHFEFSFGSDDVGAPLDTKLYPRYTEDRNIFVIPWFLTVDIEWFDPGPGLWFDVGTASAISFAPNESTPPQVGVISFNSTQTGAAWGSSGYINGGFMIPGEPDTSLSINIVVSADQYLTF